jgi:tRNA(Ile)-lysidine synthase
VALDLAPLARLPPARQRLVLRAWLRGRSIDPPSVATLEALRRDMLAAGADRIPETRWPGAVVRRYRGSLHASVTHGGDCWQAGPWRRDAAFDLSRAGRLELVAATGIGLSRARLGDELEVVQRPAGATFLPAGGAHRRELRKWLQEQGVLPWQRARLPCVRLGPEIVAIGDLAYGAALAAAPDEPSWRIVWRGRPALTEAEAVSGERGS